VPHQWKTVGHERIKRLLEKQLASESVPQSYIWTGPDGVGKRTLAEEFAGLFSGAQSSVLKFSFAGADVETVREWVSLLVLRPGASGRQVVIFDGAEHMTVASANVLLKPLEEPSLATYAIFVSSRLSLPQTVISRCQVLHFAPLTEPDLGSIAQQYGWDANPLVLATARGSARVLAECAQNPDLQQQYRAWEVDWDRLVGATGFDRLALSNKLAAEDAALLGARFEYWMSLAMRPGAVVHPKTLNVLHESWRRLSQNANKKMVLEYVCLNI
jgi:hypothetical protein